MIELELLSGGGGGGGLMKTRTWSGRRPVFPKKWEGREWRKGGISPLDPSLRSHLSLISVSLFVCRLKSQCYLQELTKN